MSNKLKAITTAAKKLYKSGKYSKWTDAIKAASKSIAGSAPKKKPTKKAPAKKVAKKTIAKKHTDTKSHNISIKVGNIGNAGNMYKVRDMLEKDVQYLVKTIETIKASLNNPDISKFSKSEYKKNLPRLKQVLMQTKRQLRQQNSLISKALK